jgi:hypothetical protein
VHSPRAEVGAEVQNCPGAWIFHDFSIGTLRSISEAAFPAMMVFDVASDTILYCAMVDIIQNEFPGKKW